MNTLGYLLFFDGLAEQTQGSFLVERVGSRLAQVSESGDLGLYRARLLTKTGCLEAEGQSRKEALHSLYRQCRRI